MKTPSETKVMFTLCDIKARLANPTPSGDGYRADCPLCGGVNTLCANENGKLLLHCQKCGAPFPDLLAALGGAKATGQIVTQQPVKPKRTPEQSAAVASKAWEKASPAQSNQPYLVKKGIGAHDLRQDRRGRLIVPARNIDGEITTYQTIDPSGKKLFLKDGRKNGSFYCFGNIEPDGRIYLSEGVATAASIHEATSKPSIIAFDASNLQTVAKALRSRYPALELVICGDDDRYKEQNAGREKATAAALAVGGKVCFPSFKSDEGKPTDFNDLHLSEGLEVVRAQIEAAGTVGPSKLDALRSRVEKLAKMEPLERDFERKKIIKEYKISAAAIDEAIKNITAETTLGSESIVSKVEPWPEAVDGEDLLNEVSTLIKKYAILPPHMAEVLSLWAVLTYCYDLFRILPQIAIYSPEKRCGKTTLLEILHAVAARGLIASNISPAAVYRTIEKHRPCLFIDEADTFYKDNDELRGICNSGHTKKTAFVIRTQGDDHEPVRFSTWGPKVIALIGTLSGTQTDRSIVINMRRKLPGEQVAKLPLDLEEDCLEIRQKCQRWVDDKKTDISLIKPKVPETGNDREQDNWGPLFSIAGCVGGGWLKAVKEALLSLAKDTDNESLTGRLLLDIRTVFTETTQEKLTSEVLVEKLKEIEDAPWSDWSRGRGLTTNALARQLRHFKIKPYQFRYGGGRQRGYSLKQFQDSFERYLSPPEPPIQTGTPGQPNNGAAFRGFQSGTEKKAVPVAKPRKAIVGLGCPGVPVENRENGEEEKNNSLWEDFS